MFQPSLKCLFAGLLLCCCVAARAAPAFIVAAPDRGFSGNEAVRDALATFADTHTSMSAELVFINDEGSEKRLDAALATLPGVAEPVLLLPLYLGAALPDMALLDAWVERHHRVAMGRPFGASAPAVAALQASLREVEDRMQTRLVLLGHGANTAAEAKAMSAQLQRMLESAAQGLGFADLRATVWADVDGFDANSYRQRLDDLASGQHPVSVLPFHLGPHLDSMMGYTPRLQSAARELDSVSVLDSGLSPHPAFENWLSREANRYRELAPAKIGVVVHAHGADWQWNQSIRDAAAPLADQYMVEYAFSMGDADTLQHAIDHLQQRGAEAVVLVRVFSMADSFRDGIVRFIGQDWESCAAAVADQQQHHGMHGGAMSTPHAPLQTALPVLTVGGVEDSPLFAKVLYQRALEISEQPERETVILGAHGLGTLEGNARWQRSLDSLRRQMLELGADRFRNIEIALWSEDWPELRQSAVEHVRGLVEDASADNGVALVIPARIVGQGPADRYLDGLEYTLGKGFVPHPLFADWLRQQVRTGVDRLHYDPDANWHCMGS